MSGDDETPENNNIDEVTTTTINNVIRNDFPRTVSKGTVSIHSCDSGSNTNSLTSLDREYNDGCYQNDDISSYNSADCCDINSSFDVDDSSSLLSGESGTKSELYENEILSLRRQIESLKSQLSDARRHSKENHDLHETSLSMIVAQNEEFNEAKMLVSQLRKENDDLVKKMLEEQMIFSEQLNSLADCKRHMEECFRAQMESRDKEISTLEKEMKSQNETIKFLLGKIGNNDAAAGGGGGGGAGTSSQQNGERRRQPSQQQRRKSSPVVQSNNNRDMTKSGSTKENDNKRSDLLASLLSFRSLDEALVADIHDTIDDDDDDDDDDEQDNYNNMSSSSLSELDDDDDGDNHYNARNYHQTRGGMTTNGTTSSFATMQQLRQSSFRLQKVDEVDEQSVGSNSSCGSGGGGGGT